MLVNIAVSLAIVAAIAGVSVFRHPASPPTISEFAPANPARQLTDAPSPLAAQNGGRHTTGPLAKPPGQGVPSALQCWSWPDGSTTQTFDRQSPPCISSWDAAAGNGGATSRGVTRSEIRIGVPAASVSEWQPYAAFFSRHYQLYGRTLRLVPLGIQRLGEADGQRSAGSAAAEQAVFAALDDPTDTSANPPDRDVYLDSLASARVLGVLTGSTQVSTTALSAQAPYGWTYPPAMDSVQRTLSAAVCRELSGHHASASAQTRSQDRRFMALVPSGLDVSALTSGLDRCHVAAPVRSYDATDRLGLEQLMADAKRDAVTTLMPFGGAGPVASALMGAAERVGYRPEWLIPGLDEQQPAALWQRAPRAQLAGLYGLASWPKPLATAQQPAAQALHELAPSASFSAADLRVYDGLALIAAGAQLAGARLTPEAFAAGLESTSFANPGAGTGPLFQPTVGFQDVDHSMVDDLAQVWWNGRGFCLVGSGQRWQADSLPYTDPGFFEASRGC